MRRATCVWPVNVQNREIFTHAHTYNVAGCSQAENSMSLMLLSDVVVVDSDRHIFFRFCLFIPVFWFSVSTISSFFTCVSFSTIFLLLINIDLTSHSAIYGTFPLHQQRNTLQINHSNKWCCKKLIYIQGHSAIVHFRETFSILQCIAYTRLMEKLWTKPVSILLAIIDECMCKHRPNW